MSLDEFWRSTPRLTNIVVMGYLRRRAWAAFHAGYGLHAKDAEFEHLMGGKREKEPMSPDEMLLNLHRHAVVHNALLKARQKAEGISDGE